MEDFKDRNLVKLPSIESLKYKLCPDLESVKNEMKVKNKYTDLNGRISFEIIGRKCNIKIDEVCSEDSTAV